MVVCVGEEGGRRGREGRGREGGREKREGGKRKKGGEGKSGGGEVSSCTFGKRTRKYVAL